MKCESMKCPFHDQAFKAVISYLHRSGQTIAFIDQRYVLTQGRPNTEVVEQACADGAISLTDDGLVLVCGMRVKMCLDMDRLRRKIEDHLRKSASRRDIIRIATCLGLDLMQ